MRLVLLLSLAIFSIGSVFLIQYKFMTFKDLASKLFVILSIVSWVAAVLFVLRLIQALLDGG